MRRGSGGRGAWLRLAVACGLLLGLAVPAYALGARAPRGRAVTAASAPRCSHVSYDATADATDMQGHQANQLDVVQTTLGLNRARTKLRLVMTFRNLSKSIPSPANYMDYEFSWANPSGDKGPNALDASVTRSGVTYSDGTLSGDIYTPSSTTAATGRFGHGRGGAIEIDAPLKELGLRVGQVLSSPVTNTYSGVSSPVVNYGRGADSDPGARYRLGQPTCIDPRR